MTPTLLCLALLTTTPSTDGWEKTAETDGVTVFRRSQPGSAIKSVKGIGVVDAPIESVALVLLDDDRAHEWVDSLAEAKVVQVLKPDEYLEYNHAKMPFVVSDRDFLTRVRMSVDHSTGTVLFTSEPAEDPKMPERRHIVRGRLSGRYVLEPLNGGAKTRLTVEIHADPRGALPAWIVNFFQKDWSHQTIAGIRKQSAKRDLKVPEVFKTFLAEVAATRTDAATAEPQSK